MRVMGFLVGVLLGGVAVAVPAAGQVGPSTAPTTRPANLTAGSPLGAITPATGAIAVPYTLSQTNHLVVRLKINGRGPYNFVVDTGAPTLLVDETIAGQIGLRPTANPATSRPTTGPVTQGWAVIDRLDVEGGLSVARVKCLVLTPYQIAGMNAVGVAGMDLHGLLGYSVLARFRMDIDLSRHRMLWTPQPAGYVPPPLQSFGPATSDAREDRLESLGGVMRFLGPLIKLQMPAPPTPRGHVGIDFADGPGATVGHVLGDTPAERAGVRAGDLVMSIDGRAVPTPAAAAGATGQVVPGQTVRLVVRRGPTTREFDVVGEEGL